MARPIIPVAIRRQTADGALEVQSKGGLWVPYRLVADSVKASVYSLARTMRYMDHGDVFPLEEFHWDLVKHDPEQVSAPNVSDTQVSDRENEQDSQQSDSETDSDLQESDSESDSDSDNTDNNNQQQQENAEMSMEDIVRRVAGELDNEQDKRWVQEMERQWTHWSDNIDQRLADFTPTSQTTELRSVISRVEIVLPETTITTDGVFHQSMPDLLFNMQLGIHTYLPGSPGTGKSHAAEQAAQALGWEFGSISFGPTTPESRLVGGMTADGSFFEPMLIKLIRFAMENPDTGAVMCLDEMDNGHAGVQATLNSLLANGWMTAPNGDHLVIGKNLVFIACANTFGTGPTAEFSGRNKLDAATLDRFAYLPWEIDLGLEEVLVRRFFSEEQDTLASHWLDVWRTARSNVQAHGLKLFVTPRGAQAGARMVAAGRSVEKSLAQVLGNKVPADQWAKVNPL